MLSSFKKYFKGFSDFIWKFSLDDAPFHTRLAITTSRSLLATLDDLSKGYITLHATSLVYTTLLSLIPMFAISFAILKGIGLRGQIRPVLERILSPLGNLSELITDRLIELVEKIEVGVLGILGILFLFYTSIALLSKIEHIFNRIWHVSTKQSWAQKISRYVSVLVIGPPLIIMALAGVATLSSSTLVSNFLGTIGLSAGITFVTKLLPYIFITLAFAFLYMIIPNTKVRIKAAFTGAIVAGLLWESIGSVFTAMIATSTNYAAVYSGFAALILFMIWLFLSWTIVLLGASIAYYTQYPRYGGNLSLGKNLTGYTREHLSLLVMRQILDKFSKGESAATLAGLAQLFNQTPEIIKAILQPLEKADYIVKTGDKTPAYFPAKSPDQIALGEFFQVIRGSKHAQRETASPDHSLVVDRLMEHAEQGISSAVEGMTLADLIKTEDTR